MKKLKIVLIVVFFILIIFFMGNNVYAKAGTAENEEETYISFTMDGKKYKYHSVGTHEQKFHVEVPVYKGETLTIHVHSKDSGISGVSKNYTCSQYITSNGIESVNYTNYKLDNIGNNEVCFDMTVKFANEIPTSGIPVISTQLSHGGKDLIIIQFAAMVDNAAARKKYAVNTYRYVFDKEKGDNPKYYDVGAYKLYRHGTSVIWDFFEEGDDRRELYVTGKNKSYRDSKLKVYIVNPFEGGSSQRFIEVGIQTCMNAIKYNKDKSSDNYIER